VNDEPKVPAARVTRALVLDDAAALAVLVRENRQFLAPWDPERPEGFFTVEGQFEVIEGLLARQELGLTVAHVILDQDGAVAGRIALDRITHGAFESCGMGYWVSEHANGRGLATAAVAAMVSLAFDELGLHRVEAGTLLHNVRSQRVLERNGFVRFGVAPSYLRIAGQWRDHALFQRLNDGWQPKD
jgi:ribosomal-protein-alanine N-acetyltransferase